jgi:hypothetical protein
LGVLMVPPTAQAPAPTPVVLSMRRDGFRLAFNPAAPPDCARRACLRCGCRGPKVLRPVGTAFASVESGSMSGHLDHHQTSAGRTDEATDLLCSIQTEPAQQSRSS